MKHASVTEANSSSFHYKTLARICLWMETASPSEARERCITKRNSSELTGEVHILFTEPQAEGRKDPLMMSKDESGTEEVG